MTTKNKENERDLQTEVGHCVVQVCSSKQKCKQQNRKMGSCIKTLSGKWIKVEVDLTFRLVSIPKNLGRGLMSTQIKPNFLAKRIAREILNRNLLRYF